MGAKFGIPKEELDPYGHFKAKLSMKYIDSLKGKKDGKLILVTAMSPTPAGEGKTTTTVGLSDALNYKGDIEVPAAFAFQQTPLETFWPAVVAAIAIPEMFSVFTFQDPTKGGETWAMKEDHVPGDLGFDPLGIKPKTKQEFKTMQTKEINNGRLAMIAAAGMIAQEIATGEKLF